jgi:hypothetical protein
LGRPETAWGVRRYALPPKTNRRDDLAHRKVVQFVCFYFIGIVYRHRHRSQPDQTFNGTQGGGMALAITLGYVGLKLAKTQDRHRRVLHLRCRRHRTRDAASDARNWHRTQDVAITS